MTYVLTTTEIYILQVETDKNEEAMIQRIFHPIGQGAFYSERHENFNIVYDCGNWKNTKLADRVVKQSFNTTDEIDILFISHFDADHVNKIDTLKTHCKKIKTVVLPLLHKNEKLFLANFYTLLKYKSLIPLFIDPENYFGVCPHDINEELVR